MPTMAAPVLLVEDDDEIRVVLVECLTEQGFTVVEAPNAEAAAEMLGRGLSPALMVTDINLGAGGTGVLLADEVRRVRPGTPVVFITGRLDMLRDRGLRQGEFLLPKPFPLTALISVVRQRALGPLPVEQE